MSALSSRLARLAVAGTLCGIAAMAALAPSPAQAYWVHPWGWRPGVVVVGPPVVYAPAPVYYGPHRAHWVHGHYDSRGYWIPPHWA